MELDEGSIPFDEVGSGQQPRVVQRKKVRACFPSVVGPEAGVPLFSPPLRLLATQDSDLSRQTRLRQGSSAARWLCEPRSKVGERKS